MREVVMSFRKVTVVLSGGGATALVKLSGVLDGVGKVKVECGGSAAGADGTLWLLGDDITEIELKRDKKVYETRFTALSDISCVLSLGDRTLTGGSGEKVDRLAVERRVAAYNRKKAERATDKSVPSRRDSDCGQTEGTGEAPLPEGAAREKASAPRGGGEHPDGARDDNGRETFDGSVGEGRQQPESISSREEDFRSARESRESGDERRYAEQNTVRGAGTRHADRAGAADVNVRSVLEEGVTYDGTNFFYAVKPQLDEMFVRYPAEDRLNAIVPNSKWVRVDTDEGDYYVLGVLYDLSTPIFICYGIPGMRNVAPPREIADVCVWLPLSADEPDGGGFWIIYQSAENGKCVR